MTRLVSGIKKIKPFVTVQNKENAQFQFPTGMMNHCMEIVKINLAEQTGSLSGYNFLRGCMMSLLFSFLNVASNYAEYITHLLTDHVAALILIEGFFSFPHRNSGANFGFDTIREEKHRQAKKFSRPRSDSIVTKKRI